MTNEMMFPEPCVVHSLQYDDECEMCQTEVIGIHRQESDTNEETGKVVAQLEAVGYEVDPMVAVAVKVDTLLASIYGKNAKGRAKYDATVAVNLLREMVRQQGEVNRERLLS